MRSWLTTIAHNRAIDQIRRRARAPQPAADLPDRPAHDDVPAAADERLRAALDALAFKQRGAVVYHYLADLPYADVGALLECSATAARP